MAHANTQRKKLTQEEKTNIDAIRRIMPEMKTTLPSLRNQDWITVKSETKKVNELLTNIPTNAITELNDLIYAGNKISLWKNRRPLEDHRRKVEIGVGTQTWIIDIMTTTTGKNTKTEHWESFGRNWKSTATRTKNRNKSLRRPTKKYWEKKGD